MTNKQFDKLMEYIDAAIRESRAHDTSDGGLSESIQKDRIQKELETELVHEWIDYN
jgi:hypothetical protein